MNIITMFPVIATSTGKCEGRATQEQLPSERSDRSNLLKHHAKHEIATSTLKNDCFSLSPRNDDVTMKYEAVVK